jgi:hypothetical protein
MEIDMNGSGLEYTTMILHRQREHELMKEAEESRLLHLAQEAARRIKNTLRGGHEA